MRIDGAMNIPDGPVVLVANHGLLGYETPLLIDALYRTRRRLARGLADRWFYRVPLLREAIELLGAVTGTQENARKLLDDGEWVLAYPGGAREAFKSAPEERYRLLWRQSEGFARLAIATGAPIVPIVAAGVDDTFDVDGAIEGSGQRWMQHDKYDLPRLKGAVLPRPVPFWFRVGAAIDPRIVRGRNNPVRALKHIVQARSQDTLDELVSEWRQACES